MAGLCQATGRTNEINPREPNFWQGWMECCEMPGACSFRLTHRCGEGHKGKVIQTIWNQRES